MELGSSGRCRFVARLICIVTSGAFRRVRGSSAAVHTALLSRVVPPPRAVLFLESPARPIGDVLRPTPAPAAGGLLVDCEIES